MTQLFDPYDRKQQIEPYSLYHHLREHEPLQRNEQRGFWVLSRHADVLAAFLDPATYSSARGSFPDDWLLTLQMVELLHESSTQPELKAEMSEYLRSMKEKSSELSILIDWGFRLIEYHA